MENQNALIDELAYREQFRMVQFQVYNWGTFNQTYKIKVAPKGYLFVGPSGSGKSSLLDGISALLTPPRVIDFNAAARLTDKNTKDRDLASYIRGAWGDLRDDETGAIATGFNREGTTWSAIALTFQNEDGRTVVLAQLMWIRGAASASSDVRRQFMIFERPFDLQELEFFPATNFELRKLKQALPDAYIKDEFRPYAERFCALLGIKSEMALRLLHKTQSAKNLGDLNAFLRDFMLDRPETFEVAERLVNEFGELNAAHQAVITARNQINVLQPARDQDIKRTGFLTRRSRLKETLAGLYSYSEQLRIDMLTEQLKVLELDIFSGESEVKDLIEQKRNADASLQDAQMLHFNSGGSAISQWEAEKRTLEETRDNRLARRRMAEAACHALNWSMPHTPAGFTTTVALAKSELENWTKNAREAAQQRDELVVEKNELGRDFTKSLAEVKSLESQTSNVPAPLLAMRKMIAGALGIGEDALPFVGELIEVKKEESEWQGAVERVLNAFAQSILVCEDHYDALARHVNQVHLGGKLVYYRADLDSLPTNLRTNEQALPQKVSVKKGRFTHWLQAELAKRFDYVGVDSVREFRENEKAFTREGQVKHNRSRHEKDDRTDINDRRRWVLGFSNTEKLALFKKQASDLAARMAEIDESIRKLESQDDNRRTRSGHCQTLANMEWSEIDAGNLLDRIHEIERKINELNKGNQRLTELAAEIETLGVKAKKVGEELRAAEVALAKNRDKAKEHRDRLQELDNDLRIIVLTPHQKQSLDNFFSSYSKFTRDKQIDDARETVSDELRKEIETTDKWIGDCENEMVKHFTEFKQRWPLDASGVEASLQCADEFFAKLERLHTDGLPKHERRFFELLQTQSNQNLAALSTHISHARKEIHSRLEIVNESLALSEFNEGTTLQITATDRNLIEVREFRQDIQSALENSWTQSDESDEARKAAEARFDVLQAMVKRLASQDPADLRWKNSVLDVRLHVEFVATEYDSNDGIVEVYQSGSGKSGGQRQKLTATCLAAALRYQLSGPEAKVPAFAPIILDEAFSNADADFTTATMKIFVNCGFQPIVATPLTKVMALEPFIGGACFVTIKDRRYSSVLMIEYDEEQKRLKLESDKHGIAQEAA